MFLSLLDLMRQRGGWPALEPFSALPEPEWQEEGADLVMRVPLPGFDPKSIQVQVSESTIALAGHQSRAERTEGQNFYRASASYGCFARTYALPALVRPGETRAQWRPGDLLEVTLRKQ